MLARLQDLTQTVFQQMNYMLEKLSTLSNQVECIEIKSKDKLLYYGDFGGP